MLDTSGKHRAAVSKTRHPQSDTAGNIICVLVVLVSSKEGPCFQQRLQVFSAARLSSSLSMDPRYY